VFTALPWWWAGLALVVSVALWVANPDLRRDWPVWGMSLWLAPAFTVYLPVWFLTALYIGWPGLFTGASLSDVLTPTLRPEDR
jgi:hypothetical protein